MVKETTTSAGSVTLLHYVDNQFHWQKRVDILNAQLSGTEAKLRELAISGEAKLREAIITGEAKVLMAEIKVLRAELSAANKAVDLYRDNMEAWKAVNNEWKQQSKDKELQFATIIGTEKDITRLDQRQNETNKRIDDKFDQVMLALKPVSEYVSANQGGAKVWYFVIAFASALVGAIVTHYIFKA